MDANGSTGGFGTIHLQGKDKSIYICINTICITCRKMLCTRHGQKWTRSLVITLDLFLISIAVYAWLIALENNYQMLISINVSDTLCMHSILLFSPMTIFLFYVIIVLYACRHNLLLRVCKCCVVCSFTSRYVSKVSALPNRRSNDR